MTSSPSRSGLFVWAAASAVAMVVGALGPWTEGFFVASVSGVEDGNDGWLVIAASVAGAAAVYWAASRHALAGGAAAVVCGGVGAVVTLVERGQVETTGFGPFTAEAGWGLTLAMLASFSLLLAGIAVFFSGLREHGRPARKALPPGREQPALERGAIPMPAAPERALPPGDEPEGTPVA
ncbi:MAG TPA: hypothetical protein VH950_15845 [Gaiellaceae bacterium]|jgi:hypothetical protein